VGDEGSHVALGRSVIIVGTGSLQNKLLANLIRAEDRLRLQN